MSSLFKKALARRTHGYPELVADTERKYKLALDIAEKVHINMDGDVVEEVEKFRVQLREYDLGMMTCLNSAENLLMDVQNDMASVGEFGRTSGEENAMGDINAQLADCCTRLLIVRNACREHRKIAERARKRVELALEQGSLKRLSIIVDEMKSIDSEERAKR